MWIEELRFDPTRVLLSSDSEALIYFARRDLFEEKVEPIQRIWTTPEVQYIMRKQKNNGSWITKKPGDELKSRHYSLIETWKTFRILVEEYELARADEKGRRAAEFILSFQTPEGDIRGILANQYATYYTGAILADLIKAGYIHDTRIDKGLRWLLSMRQNDGGWTIPILTHEFDRRTMHKLATENLEPVEPDRSKPFSHNWTDMVLRAFAAHPDYRTNSDVRRAAELLKSSFFKPDTYSSMRAASYWIRFQFWWPNLVTALDSLSLLGFDKNDRDIDRAVRWLIDHQQKDGSWKTTYETGKKGSENKRTRARELWLTLRICRIIKRLSLDRVK